MVSSTSASSSGRASSSSAPGSRSAVVRSSSNGRKTRRQHHEMDGNTEEEDATAASRFEIQLDQAVLETLDATLANRPKNTKRSYGPKQEEFLAWCAKQSCDPMTRDKVTGKKLHLFLREEVIGRAPQPHTAKKRRVEHDSAAGGERREKEPAEPSFTAGEDRDDDIEGEEDEDGELEGGEGILGASAKTIGWSTVKGYVTAVTDLWQQQQLRGVNSDPNPRQGPVTQLLAVEQLKETERKRSQHVDRGIGTHMDGYSREQMRLVVDHFVHRNSDASLRDCVCFLLSHFALLRGDDLRPIELADIHHLEMRNEGLSDCFAVMLLLRSGKTNKHGRVEFGSFIRNKDASICPVGFLAFYLFSRFHVVGLPAPDFTSADRWYPLKLFRATKNGTTTKAISYNTQLDSIDDAFEAAGIVGSAKTHLARRSGAQMAELGGAEEGQCCLRVHAGFTRDGGSYSLSRDVHVKEELLKKVFPWADDWDAAISTGKTADGKRVEINIAARGFVRLLLRLRKVIIQDAVVLRKIFPNWFVWSHSLFGDRLFLQYERDLLESLDTPAASDDRIVQVLPLLADQIAANTAAMQQAMASGFVAVGAQIASFSHQQNIILAEQQKFHGAQIQALHQHINALSGMYMGALSARPPLSTTTPSPIAAHGLPSSTGSTTAADSSSTHSFADTARSPRPSLPSLLPPTSLPPSSSFSPVLPSLPLLGPFPPVSPVVSQQPASAAARLEAPTPVTADNGAVVARDEEVMPPFAQDRAVSSVVQLWTEWEYGLGGRVSVSHMDLRWGNKWRTKDAIRKHYSRRINIIARINSLAAERHTTSEVAAQLLDSARTDQNGKQLSLFQLNEKIKDGAFVIPA
ncbi:hypothetical protein A4X06_0g7249 [Tilletia controversa]|uniref:Transcription activator GCR1-like domain-containing protein n=1 Tax=Tilletia controversa TaxID=13291 RepID=A0A8X7SU41_9BASI|nr:hypothetical protein CF328_g6329 [Tilletia controversa]KAE8242089.1 hypothetical protein A4X06_0g7249 [Tilletia controversa]